MAKHPLRSDDILAKIERMTPPRRTRLHDVAVQRQRGLMVVMEDVYNIHNLSAIARSCDAFGVHQLAFTMEDELRFDPAEEGSITSASASKWLEYRIFRDGTLNGLNTLKAEGWHIVATVATEDAVPIYDLDFTQYEKLAVLVGNEHKGLSQNAISLADTKMTIPMLGMIQSFNVSVATAMTLFEINRQRVATGRNYRVDEDTAEAIFQEFVERS